MMTTGIPWWIAYPSFAGVMLLIAMVTYSIVRRISREQKLSRRARKTRPVART